MAAAMLKIAAVGRKATHLYRAFARLGAIFRSIGQARISRFGTCGLFVFMVRAFRGLFG